MRLLGLWMLVVACSAPAPHHPTDAGHDAPIVPRDAWFGDTNAADTGACTTHPTSADVMAIVQPTCAVPACHSRFSPEPGGGLIFDRGTPREATVGVGSEYDPNVFIVIPGDPGHSFLFRKITNDLADGGTEGNPMPQGDTMQWVPLPVDQIETIRCWIAEGAP